LISQEQTKHEQARVIARNALKLLLMGSQNDWTMFLRARVLYAVFIKRDPGLLRALRAAFREGFQHLWQTHFAEQAITKDSPEWQQAQFFLSNCLTLLPYADISAQDVFKIPQWVDDQWQQVEYLVEPIELTPRKGWRSFFLYPEDRVYAYGLKPVNFANATPHLIFMGTTYPAGQGFVSHIQTDLDAMGMPGDDLYRTGHTAIDAWVNKQTNLIHVCGTSLGGALSLTFVREYKNNVSRVDALNPPGLYAPTQEQWQGPEVFIQKQNNDPVSAFGYWIKGWRIVHSMPSEAHRHHWSMLDHAMSYAGLEGTEFSEQSAEEDNNARHCRNFYIYFLLRSAVDYLFVLPYIYIVRPIIKPIFDVMVFLIEKIYACACPEPESEFEPELEQTSSFSMVA